MDKQFAKIIKQLQECRGGVTPLRFIKIDKQYRALTPVQQEKCRVVQVPDEFTGRRYGTAKKREGMCFKLGGGGRRAGDIAYQIWMDWS